MSRTVAGRPHARLVPKMVIENVRFRLGEVEGALAKGIQPGTYDYDVVLQLVRRSLEDLDEKQLTG